MIGTQVVEGLTRKFGVGSLALTRSSRGPKECPTTHMHNSNMCSNALKCKNSAQVI